MIIVILLSCFTTVVSAAPTRPDGLPPLLSQGGATQATNQKHDAQTPAPLSPQLEQPQPGMPQLQVPQVGPQFLPAAQHYMWSPLGGSAVIFPLQPSFHGSQPANLPILPQQPLIFPPNRYFPLFSSPYMNQLVSPYGFPLILAPPSEQIIANHSPNSPLLPAEAPSGVAPSGNAPQTIQQQQNPQIVYMLQQPMNPELGSLSSEELEMAAEMGMLGVYLLTNPSARAVEPVTQAAGLTNPTEGAFQPVNEAAGLANPTEGAVQPVNEAAGLANPEQQGIVPTVGTSSAGVPQTQGPGSSGPQPNINGGPVGLEGPTQEVATVQTPVEPKLQPTKGKPVVRLQPPAETTHNILRKTKLITDKNL